MKMESSLVRVFSLDIIILFNIHIKFAQVFTVLLQLSLNIYLNHLGVSDMMKLFCNSVNFSDKKIRKLFTKAPKSWIMVPFIPTCKMALPGWLLLSGMHTLAPGKRLNFIVPLLLIHYSLIARSTEWHMAVHVPFRKNNYLLHFHFADVPVFNVFFCNFIPSTFYVILWICFIFLWKNVICYNHIDNLTSAMEIEYRRGNIYQKQPYFGNSYHQLESREKRACSTIVFDNSFK